MRAFFLFLILFFLGALNAAAEPLKAGADPAASLASPLPAVADTGHVAASLTSPGDSLDNIFDDRLLIDGYSAKLSNAPKDILLAMINDDSLYPYKKAAAIRVFRERFAPQMVQSERVIIERVLLRQMERASSVFVQVEIMHTLVIMDRYRYFDAMVPALVQKMDHYDDTVSDLADKALNHIIEAGNQRTREARIVFNTLRKTFFLARKKLQNADPNDSRLKKKIQLLRWSVKILGTEELKNLPKEVINLM
ncbi:MAG: hypothetical protein HQL16_02065 [Candidatus Omnitrophica bacterium]|nr:hypothetical protein [Candidatus Omnitrophota bacterium]